MTRGSGDAWVYGPGGGRFWGRFGAAGLLLHDPERGVLLQHRAVWSHFGDTWGLPGGARHEEESAVEAALREAREEAGVPPEVLRVLFTSVVDLGFWSYTTVVAESTQGFDPVVSDAESIALRWVKPDEIAGYPLHPGFATSWPELQRRLASFTPN